MKNRTITALALAATATLALAACDSTGPKVDEQSYSQVEQNASGRTPYLPKNDVEFNNYNAAQKLYDTPDAIIWCTTTWGNASAPLVTVPIAGKLTSSSVSYFSNETRDTYNGTPYLVERRSVDGMFHGNPPAYRYGFTPGGQYVDFSGMEVFCTTSLTEFQRQETAVSVSTDGAADAIQQQAEQALRDGDQAKAQELLEGVTTGADQ